MMLTPLLPSDQSVENFVHDGKVNTTHSADKNMKTRGECMMFIAHTDINDDAVDARIARRIS